MHKGLHARAFPCAPALMVTHYTMVTRQGQNLLGSQYVPSRYVQTYMHTYIHTYTRTWRHENGLTNIHTYTPACIRAYIHVIVRSCKYTYADTRIQAHVQGTSIHTNCKEKAYIHTKQTYKQFFGPGMNQSYGGRLA